MSKFNTDLVYGNSIEKAFFEKNAHKLNLLDGRKGDLQLLKSGKIIELKAERRKSTDTGNIFVERYSHRVNKTPGGPWQSKEHGAVFILYLFSDDILFCYDIDIMILWLEAHWPLLKGVNVRNSNAFGYVVPLEKIRHLEITWETIW